MTTEEIKERIAQYEEIINDASEDQTTRDFAQKKVDKLKEQIADGDDDAEEIDEADSGELEVDEIYGDGDEEFQEEVEEAEATPTKPGPKEKKKKSTKTKGRGRPKKRGRPAKRKATKKAAPTKAKAKKMSKDLGLSVKECEDLLEKYNSEDKARKSRLSKRKKAGKSAELSVSESLEKEVKTVKNKVEDKKTATTKTQAKSQGNKITELVKAILQGIDKKQDKIKQIDAIIKGLVAEKKSIMAKKGVGSFLVGTALGGYAGYKAGLSEDKTELKDLFKGEKKLAKDFKEAVKDKRKKDDSYTEFEEIYAKGGKIDRDEPIVEFLVSTGDREHLSLFRPKDHVIVNDETGKKFKGKDATVKSLREMDEEELVQLMYGEGAYMTDYGVDIGDGTVTVDSIMTMGEFIDRGYAKGGEIGWKSMDDRKLESLNETAIRFFNQLSEKGKEQYKQELMRLKKAFPYKSGTENWTMVVNQMNGFDEEYGEGTLGMRRNISASEYRYGLQIMALESSMKDNGLKEYAEGGTTYDEIQDEKIYNNLGGINNNLKGIQNLYQKNPSLKMASGGKTESNIDDAMFGRDKWLPEDDDSIREYQEIEDDGDVKDMIEYLNSYSDEEVLSERYGVTSSDFPAIAKKIMKKSFAKGGVPKNAKWEYPIYFDSEDKEFVAIYYSNEEDVNEADEDFDNRTYNDITPDVIKEYVDDKYEEVDVYELSKNDKFMDELGYALETSSISPEKVDYAKGGNVVDGISQEFYGMNIAEIDGEGIDDVRKLKAIIFELNNRLEEEKGILPFDSEAQGFDEDGNPYGIDNLPFSKGGKLKGKKIINFYYDVYNNPSRKISSRLGGEYKKAFELAMDNVKKDKKEGTYEFNKPYAKGGTTYDKEQDERIDENQNMSEEGVQLGDSAWGEFEPRLDKLDNKVEDNTEDITSNKREIDHYGLASSDALDLAQENEETIDNMRQGTNKVLNNLYEKNPSLKMAHGGKTPKLKVRKSFYRTTLGANEKTGTGEDMRNVYHLHIEGTGSGQNYLLHSSTVNEEFLKENAPGGYDSGFYVDEEVYVDFTDKDGKKKKGYMLVNNPDLAVRILRDRYGAVSVEDITMEWEMGDKGKNFEDYTNSF